MKNPTNRNQPQPDPTTYTVDNIPQFGREAAVTFGVFDGVHRGHQAVIDTLLKQAAQQQLISVLLAFYPHPLAFLAPDRCPPLLTPLTKRIGILQQLGIDKILTLKFDAHIAAMPPETFIENVLLRKCRARHIVVGYACNFGKDRAGNAQRLKQLSQTYSFDASIVPPAEMDGAPVHSTRIREALVRGDLHATSHLLGRPYSLLGKIVHGDGRGTAIGFPTANIDTRDQVCPPNGVYAVRAKLTERWLNGVLNIGTRPTFNDTTVQIETHFLNFNEIIYGRPVEIFFIEKIRNERKFPNPGTLVQQIRRDINTASKILEDTTCSYHSTDI